jgi:hypothetical protein
LNGRPIDAVIDCVGGDHYFESACRCAYPLGASKGRYVTIVGPEPDAAKLSYASVVFKLATRYLTLVCSRCSFAHTCCVPPARLRSCGSPRIRWFSDSRICKPIGLTHLALLFANEALFSVEDLPANVAMIESGKLNISIHKASLCLVSVSLFARLIYIIYFVHIDSLSFSSIFFQCLKLIAWFSGICSVEHKFRDRGAKNSSIGGENHFDSKTHVI